MLLALLRQSGWRREAAGVHSGLVRLTFTRCSHFQELLLLRPGTSALQSHNPRGRSPRSGCHTRGFVIGNDIAGPSTPVPLGPAAQEPHPQRDQGVLGRARCKHQKTTGNEAYSKKSENQEGNKTSPPQHPKRLTQQLLCGYFWFSTSPTLDLSD